MEKAENICGIVMPISEIDGLSENHWKEVLSILSDAVIEANFTPNLVSNSEDIGVIQKRIVQNLYENPILVCDVSGKNPNVMFELGLRLAFDKPTIIIKDDKTSYSFDTSPIEHLEYPRDLRFSKMVEFKKQLVNKIKKTYAKANEDSEYSTFLKHFGSFKVAEISTEVVSKEEIVLDEIKSLRDTVMQLMRTTKRMNIEHLNLDIQEMEEIIIDFGSEPIEVIESYMPRIHTLIGVENIVLEQNKDSNLVKVYYQKEVGKPRMFMRLNKILGDKIKGIK